MVAGWGVGQHPWLLVDAVEIDAAAGARPTLWALLVVFALAAVTVVPSLAYLYWVTRRSAWVEPVPPARSPRRAPRRLPVRDRPPSG